MANTEHIAERKTVGAQGAQPDPQQRGVQSVGQQVVPEQDDDTGETQRGGGPEAARRLLAKKRKLLMALNSTAIEKITDSRPVLIQAAAV